jgi:Rrf2 family cysteine metabolism transcriptional repressor
MFSTKAEYGVRVMAHLARRSDDGDGEATPISLTAIAEAEGLPLAYLEHLVARLRRAHLVESRRGAHGGYTLARRADGITMAEVVEALEGEIAPIECISADANGTLVCVRDGEPGHEPCPTKLLWTRVQGSIVRTLTDMTLADLVRPLTPTKVRRSRTGYERPDAESQNQSARLEASRDHERPDAESQNQSARLEASRG